MTYKNENIKEENFQREYNCIEYLKYTLEKTDYDFLMLKNGIKKYY